MAKILTDDGMVRKLAGVCGVSPRTVYSALRFQTHSAVANKIRKTAFLWGCQLKKEEIISK